MSEWIEAAGVMKKMSHNRLGCMGHYYGGMLDVYSDLTLQLVQFGGHIEMLEVDELSAIRRTVTEKELNERLELFREEFEIRPDCRADDLAEAARTSIAMDKLVRDHDLGSLAYFYNGTGIPENEESLSTIILANSLLTARGIPDADLS